MRSIDVRVEPTVRLVREGEGVDNTDIVPLSFGEHRFIGGSFREHL